MDFIQVQYSETKGFKRDLKKLSRKYKTLPEDLENYHKNQKAVEDFQRIQDYSALVSEK